MKALFEKLFSGKSLSREEANTAFQDLINLQFNPSQVAAFLTVFRLRSISTDELQGFRDAALSLSPSLDLPYLDTVDLCGTGGDGKDTFNISTTAAFVVSAMRIKEERVYVTKHGNYAVSSRCGSTNLLEALTVFLPRDKDGVRRSLDKTGIAFLHAPFFHPAMKNVAPIRKELGFKTFFNILGPLINPARPSAQLLGAYSRELAELYSTLLKRGNTNYSIVHSLDGYDEVSLTAPTLLITAKGSREITAEDLKLNTYQPWDLQGATTIQDAAVLTQKILSGKGTKAQTEVVIANAALAFQTAKQHLPLESCVAAATEALQSGNASKTLTQLQEITQ